MEAQTYSPFRDFGYMQWTDAVLNLPIKPTQKTILQVLAAQEVKHRECMISWPELAKRVGVHHNTIGRNVKPLEEAGLITKISSGGKPIKGDAKREVCIYRFVMTKELAALLQEREVMAKIEDHHQNGDVPEGDHHQNGDPTTHTKMSRESKEEERSSSSSLSSDNNIGEGVLHHHFGDAPDSRSGQNDRFRNEEKVVYEKTLDGSLSDRFESTKRKLEMEGEEIRDSITLEDLEREAQRFQKRWGSEWGSETSIRYFIRDDSNDPY